MTDIYVRGALFFVVFVVFAITITVFGNRLDSKYPEWRSYLFAAIFLFSSLYLVLDRSHLAVDDPTMRLQGGVMRYRMALSSIFFLMAIWFGTEKSRMKTYFDRMMHEREEVGAD